jgi:hypothetical protein
MRLHALLGVAAVLLASRTAAADEPEPEPDAPREHVAREWYGWQTLASDGLSFTMMGLGVGSLAHEVGSSQSDDRHTTSAFLMVTGATGYLLGAPTVHALHGHWGKAGASLALRGGPIALGSMVALAGRGREAGGAAAGAIMFFGVIAAVIVDSAVVANEDAPPPPPAVSFAPTYDPKSRTGGVTLAASF